ncbi:MAG: HAMP domain-containing histidine kinase [Magnetococcus sp. DMHC-6]
MPKLKNITLKTKTFILLITLALFYVFSINMKFLIFSHISQSIIEEKKFDDIQESINEIISDIFKFNIAIQEMLSEGIVNIHISPTILMNTNNMPVQYNANLHSLKTDFLVLIDQFKVDLHHSIKLSVDKKSLLNILDHFNSEIDQLRDSFIKVFSQRELIGFTENEGLQGTLRETIHRVERTLETLQRDDLMVALLELRRREKDYFMRRHQESLDKYHIALSNMMHFIPAITEQNSATGQQLQQDLNLYAQVFRGLCEEMDDFDKEKSNLMQIITDILDKIIPLKKDVLFKLKNEATALQKESYQNALHHLQMGTSLIFALMGGMIFMLFLSVRKPITILQNHALKIANGHYDENISLSGHDEIGQLATHLQTMKEALRQHTRELERKIALRTEHLQITNRVLEETIRDLKRLQAELVSSEKMASLGRLVAGFAHEINTPIGVALTSTSTIPESIQRLAQMLEQDEIEEWELEALFKRLTTSSDLVISNLRRASDIVTRFKRTSADQASEETRLFDLRDTLEDVVASVHNVFKRSSITIKIECPHNCKIRSQPGSLGQVLTNLLMNSHKHAYNHGEKPGLILIKAHTIEHILYINFIDDGKGMAPQTLEKIFEPFFTTARDSGGSGLGLYICFNIITSQLHGRINCQSTLGMGTQFQISFPFLV